MAEATGRRRRMRHRRRLLDLPHMAIDAGITLYCYIVTRQLLDIRRDGGGDTKSPTYKYHQDRQDT
jgi:hypothetical protein